MKLNTKNALYLAAVILLVAASISQFQDADLIWATLMVFTAVITLLLGLREDKKRTKCNTVVNTKSKILGVTLGVAAVFFGLGFSIGKLIYLWSH